MKVITTRLPASDLSALTIRFEGERGAQSEFIRQAVANYLADKSKIALAVGSILAGARAPIDSDGPKKPTSVYIEKEQQENLKDTAKRLGYSLDSFLGLIIHDALSTEEETT